MPFVTKRPPRSRRLIHGPAPRDASPGAPPIPSKVLTFIYVIHGCDRVTEGLAEEDRRIVRDLVGHDQDVTFFEIMDAAGAAGYAVLFRPDLERIP